MAKYISKEGENIVGNGYFVSHLTNEALKPIFEQCYDVSQEKVEEVLYDSQFMGAEGCYQSTYQPCDNVNIVWLSNVNQVVFEELITYQLPCSLQTVLERIKTH